jgi:curved DNA-binding protein CbpA
MSWFAGCKNYEEIKARYRDLAKKHHPDRGGDTRTMQDINREFDYWRRQARSRTYGSHTSSSTAGGQSTNGQRSSGQQQSSQRGQQQQQNDNKSRWRVRKAANVRMPEGHHQAYTRTVEYKPATYRCRYCWREVEIDHYPGSFLPSYCIDPRCVAKHAEEKRRQNADRQRAFRERRRAQREQAK